MSLTDKIALLTGATGDLGRAILEALLAEGMRVIGIGRNQAKLGALAQRHGDRILPLKLDVSRPEEIATLKARLPEGWGEVHAVINNAGIAGGAEGKASLFADTPPEAILQSIHTNLLGPMLICQAFLPQIRACQGHIINIGSISDTSFYPGNCIYSAGKAGFAAFSHAMLLEEGCHGVHVTLIKPGPADTEMPRKWLQGVVSAAAQPCPPPAHPTLLEPEAVARSVICCLKLPSGMNIDTMVVNATGNTTGRGVSRGEVARKAGV